MKGGGLTANIAAYITSFATVLVTALLAVLCVVLCAQNNCLPLFFGTFIPALLLDSVIHELGHMLFGAIAKIRTKPKFAFLKPSSCKMMPKTEKNLRGRIIFTAAGGNFFMLAFTVLGVLALSLPQIPLGLCGLLPYSFYLFAVNAVPFEYRGGKTDGLVILELILNTDSAKVMLAVFRAQALVLSGAPIESLDENLLFSVPQIREDDVNFIALVALRCEYFKAKGEGEKAELWQKRYEELKQYLSD